jgi:hypothetical protein
MVAESVKTKSGAERCRKKLSSLHRGASAVCGVYRRVAEGEAENKARSLRAGEAPAVLQAEWVNRRYLLARYLRISFLTLSNNRFIVLAGSLYLSISVF